MESKHKQAQYTGVTELAFSRKKMEELKTAILSRREQQGMECVAHSQLRQMFKDAGLDGDMPAEVLELAKTGRRSLHEQVGKQRSFEAMIVDPVEPDDLDLATTHILAAEQGAHASDPVHSGRLENHLERLDSTKPKTNLKAKGKMQQLAESPMPASWDDLA